MDLDCFARSPEFLLEIQEEVRMNCVFASPSAKQLKQSLVVQIASRQKAFAKTHVGWWSVAVTR